MPINTKPVLIKDPILWTANLTNQVVNRSPGSSVPILLGTAGANGSLIESVSAFALGDNVASTLRVFLKTTSNSNYTPILEKSLTAVSGSGNTASITGYPIEMDLVKVLTPIATDASTPHKALRLPAGYSLYVALGTAIASGIIIVATGGDY